MKRRLVHQLLCVIALAASGLVIPALSPLGFTRTALASTLTVTNTNDSGMGSLRQAVIDANPGDTITFNLALPATITLTGGAISIGDLTIMGPGPNLLTVSGGGGPTIAAGLSARVFEIGGSNTAISGLSITNGQGSSFGGGIISSNTGTLTITNCTISSNTALATGPGDCFGGGLLNGGYGTTNVTNCTISGNTAFNEGFSAGGGGICNGGTGTLNITGCTISANTAFAFTNSDGGGIVNSNTGTVNVINSTIAGNSSRATTRGGGGGISNRAGTVHVTNSTIAGNTATSFAGGIDNEWMLSLTNSTIAGNAVTHSFVPGGGGVFSERGQVKYKNSIIALNTVVGSGVGPDVDDALAASLGHNLIGKGDGSPFFVNGVNGDQVGSIASPLDPRLGPLQNNGGPTATMALLQSSPAIDAGDDSVLGATLFLTTDQRGAGFPRKFGAHVDIGAFEFSFDTCLRDNSSGNLLQFSSATGQYKFTRCSDGFMLTGIGAVRLANGILTLTDSKPDRRVSAGFILSQRTGSATIYIMIGQGVWQTFRISSTNPAAVCGCGT